MAAGVTLASITNPPQPDNKHEQDRSKFTTIGGTNTGQNLKKLAGVVERITFQSPETGYTVARLLPEYPSSPKSSSSASSSSSVTSNNPAQSSTSPLQHQITTVNNANPNSSSSYPNLYPPPSAAAAAATPPPIQRSFFKQARGDDNLVTIVGTMTGVAPGEALELSGWQQQYPQHGWQFKVENYLYWLPGPSEA